jgi:S-DNA-T family DNA segregation ATPase FtsK/SpoIIIE
MLDPKMVELSRFNGLPHLIGPVETDTERIIGVLKWCTQEMDRRYKLLEEHAVRNLDNYNAKFGRQRRGKDYMPHIVILIDEIGDLMLSRPEETETAITRLAQMARAVGMHLIVATQRPSVDVITGLIKANFPARIAFSVASNIDSRVILDSSGAEALLGHGDMLYLAPDAGAPRRVQGCYVSDEEVRSIVKHWVDWARNAPQEPSESATTNAPWERGLTRRELLAETDPMLEAAIEYVVETQEASASLLQRKLGLGYPRAARLMDLLGELGVVGELVGGGRARRVLIAKGEDPFKRILDNRLNGSKSAPPADANVLDD